MKEGSNFLGYKDAQIVGHLYLKDNTILQIQWEPQYIVRNLVFSLH